MRRAGQQPQTRYGRRESAVIADRGHDVAVGEESHALTGIGHSSCYAAAEAFLLVPERGHPQEADVLSVTPRIAGNGSRI